MKRVKFDAKFTALTVGILAILVLQAAGLLYGINEWVNSRLPLVDTPLMNFLTAFGDDIFLVPVIGLSLYLDWREQGRISTETASFLLSALIGLATVGALKVLFAEPRPRPLPGASFLSMGAFPSGHTFRAAIIASYVSDRWKQLAPLAWIYAVGIALTRLFLHYHWFGDVLFSLLFAPWIYYLVESLFGGKFQ